MSDQYATIAEVYDSMAADPAIQAIYDMWRQSLLDVARQRSLPLRVIVDIACGTGNSTIPWTRRRGLTVVGVDGSPAMLRQARKKSKRVRWYRQDLTRLRLDERADAVTCHFDALNHLLDSDSLQRVFRNVARLLREGGIFQFDLSTGDWLRWLKGRDKLFKAGRHFFVAQNELDESGMATFRQTWFVARGRLFEKRLVVVRERAYPEAAVRRMLKTAGFDVVTVSPQHVVDGKTMRLLYVAVKRGPRRGR